MKLSPAEFLFVYGTLRRDIRHEMYRLLARNADFVGDATFQGRLYLVDDFPGAVSSPSSEDCVRGEVYRLEEPQQVLSKLDDYEEFDPQSPEAGLYRRVKAMVLLDDDTPVDAWIYLYNRPTAGLLAIPSGDFLQITTIR